MELLLPYVKMCCNTSHSSKKNRKGIRKEGRTMVSTHKSCYLDRFIHDWSMIRIGRPGSY